MVKITYCDRCGIELKRIEKSEDDGFGDFEDFGSAFENFGQGKENILNGKLMPNKVLKVQLCQDCVKGYNNIVNKANEEIRSYLKEKNVKKEKKTSEKKKKFGLF